MILANTPITCVHIRLAHHKVRKIVCVTVTTIAVGHFTIITHYNPCPYYNIVDFSTAVVTLVCDTVCMFIY